MTMPLGDSEDIVVLTRVVGDLSEVVKLAQLAKWIDMSAAKADGLSASSHGHLGDEIPDKAVDVPSVVAGRTSRNSKVGEGLSSPQTPKPPRQLRKGVLLSVVWPPEFGSARISNDGGFAGAQEFALEPEIPWTLDSSGPERLPKTVYLRFGESIQTFTDDIILDQTNPSIRSASALRRGGKVLLRTSASDAVSGVARMQVGPRKSSKLKKVRYRRSLRVSTRGKKLWIRVTDRAGNHSKWISRPVKKRR